MSWTFEKLFVQKKVMKQFVECDGLLVEKHLAFSEMYSVLVCLIFLRFCVLIQPKDFYRFYFEMKLISEVYRIVGSGIVFYLKMIHRFFSFLNSHRW